jgi:hypothetical protein
MHSAFLSSIMSISNHVTGVYQPHGNCHIFERSRIRIFHLFSEQCDEPNFLGNPYISNGPEAWMLRDHCSPRLVHDMHAPHTAREDDPKMATRSSASTLCPFCSFPISFIATHLPPFLFLLRSFLVPLSLHPCPSLPIPVPLSPSLSHFLFFTSLLFSPVLSSLPDLFYLSLLVR